jgi:hypothetical protein
MAVIGGEHLLQAGYTPAHLAALEQVSAQVGRNVRVSPTGAEIGAPVLRWDYPVPNPSHEWQKLAGIKGTWRGNLQGWEVLPEAHVQTQFTEQEKIYPPILERDPGQRLAFNPFQHSTKAGYALGELVSPGGQRKTVAIKGYTKEELAAAVRQVEAGKDIKYYRVLPKTIPISVIKKALEQGIPLEKLPSPQQPSKISLSQKGRPPVSLLENLEKRLKERFL